MTKQEEIREGIANYLKNKDSCHIDWDWEYGFADEILAYLHSQGVVIKVEGKLPFVDWNVDERRGFLNAIEAGFTAWKSLIEEGKDK